MLKGCKFRIYPTKEQEKILLIYCKYAHTMRNFLVAKFKDLDKKPKVSKYGIIGYTYTQFLQDFGETEIPLPERLIKGVFTNYCLSLKEFYKGNTKKPKFHKYNPNKQSFYIPSRDFKVSNSIYLPHALNFSIKGMSKIKVDIKYINKFNIIKITEPRFVFEKSKWYVSGSYKVPDVKNKKIKTLIGLDWGIKNFMTSSVGNFINYPKSVEREFYRINKLKSIRDKKIKNSKNWNKLNNKVILAYERFENLKKDFIEQITTKLCRDFNIAVEDLTNAKIKVSNKSRRRLQLIAPLRRFTEKLEWKCKKFGTNFYKVNPAYTTQTCSCCGNLMKLSLKDRICNCSCGNNMDRDINAAINIAAKAVRSSL